MAKGRSGTDSAGRAGKAGYSGGRYANKAQNLTAKQLKAQGAAKAAKKRTVDISQTTRAKGKGVTLGPGGKPLTGTVTMGNGNTAVYKNGKRVTNAPKAKPAAKPSTRSSSASRGSSPSRSGSSSGSSSSNSKPNVPIGTIRKGRAGNAYNRWDGKKWVPVAAARTSSGSNSNSNMSIGGGDFPATRPIRAGMSGSAQVGVNGRGRSSSSSSSTAGRRSVTPGMSGSGQASAYARNSVRGVNDQAMRGARIVGSAIAGNVSQAARGARIVGNSALSAAERARRAEAQARAQASRGVRRVVLGY